MVLSCCNSSEEKFFSATPFPTNLGIKFFPAVASLAAAFLIISHASAAADEFSPIALLTLDFNDFQAELQAENFLTGR